MSGETMSDKPMHNPQSFRNAVYALDAVAVGAGFASWLDWLPPIAALLSILWLSIQIGTWVHTTFFKK